MQFGKYRLERLLARGGMAEVYLAVEQGALAGERRVVIKRILPRYVDDPDYVEFFVDEGKVCLALSHPNVVQAYELGCVDGMYFLALEYVRGESLIAALRRATLTNHNLSFPFVAYVGKCIAAALDHAHSAHDVRGKALNVIHRDVSPHNILLGFDGTVKLADFGIARADIQQHETATGVVKGKFAYLAPEQLPMLVGGGSFDHRIDLFALGIVLHEMITRRPLFRGKNDADTVARLVKGRVPSPLELRRECPPALARIVMRALERDRERRWPTAAAMAAELEAVALALGGGMMGAREEIRSIFGVCDPAPSALGTGKLAAAKRVARDAPTVRVPRLAPRGDEVTRERPALEVVPEPLAPSEGLSELEVEPLDLPASVERVRETTRLPLPPPAEGGSAPRLVVRASAPSASEQARPFRFGTQPRALVITTPAPAPLPDQEAERVGQLAAQWLAGGGAVDQGGPAPPSPGKAGRASPPAARESEPGSGPIMVAGQGGKPLPVPVGPPPLRPPMLKPRPLATPTKSRQARPDQGALIHTGEFEALRDTIALDDEVPLLIDGAEVTGRRLGSDRALAEPVPVPWPAPRPTPAWLWLALLLALAALAVLIVLLGAGRLGP